MDKQEMAAEAIIVVGPFLWKCVNCDILMSRIHSIDQHLVLSHHSQLYPQQYEYEEPGNKMECCSYSKCSCHTLPMYINTDKTKRKNESDKCSVKRSSKLMKRNVVESHSAHSFFVSNDDMEKKENGYCTVIISEPREASEGEAKGDLLFSECVVSSNTSSDKDDKSELLCEADDQFLVGAGDLPVLNPGIHEQEADAPESNILIPTVHAVEISGLNSGLNPDVKVESPENRDHEESFNSSSNSGKFEDDPNERENVHKTFDLSDVTVWEVNIKLEESTVRKSRRSKKGQNSIFKEFEMSIS